MSWPARTWSWAALYITWSSKWNKTETDWTPKKNYLHPLGLPLVSEPAWVFTINQPHSVSRSVRRPSPSLSLRCPVLSSSTPSLSLHLPPSSSSLSVPSCTPLCKRIYWFLSYKLIGLRETPWAHHISLEINSLYTWEGVIMISSLYQHLAHCARCHLVYELLKTADSRF